MLEKVTLHAYQVSSYSEDKKIAATSELVLIGVYRRARRAGIAKKI
jgi:hypothetical protein